MAKVKLGGLIGDVRGSVGGSTFGKNRSGAYMRQKVSPVQPLSGRQLAQRAIFTTSSQAWRDLTDNERAQWESFAANHPVVDVFGNAMTLQGNAAFTKINSDRQTLGLAIATTPPADDVTMPAEALSAVADTSDHTVTITTETQATATGYYMVWTTGGKSPGARAQNSDFRLAYVGASASSGTTIAVDPLAFNDRLGFAEGQKVGVIVDRLNPDGLMIDSTRFDLTAVA